MSKNGSVFGSILLATDGTPSSQQAAEVAAKVAKAFDSEVTVLSVMPSISATSAPLEGEYYARIVNTADDNADKAAAVFKKAGVEATEKEIPKGRSSVVETIVEFAEKSGSALVVVGTRGLGTFRRTLLGSVSSGVAAHSPCPTLVVKPARGRSAQALRRIVVAVDGSEYAQRALEAAISLAKTLGADLEIAHVVFIPALFWSMGVPGSDFPTQRLEDDAEKAARQVLAKAVKFANDAGIKSPKQALITDLVSPAEGIVRLCKKDKADLVVVGTRGNSGFRRLLLGSVANSVLHYADCSVLVTK